MAQFGAALCCLPLLLHSVLFPTAAAILCRHPALLGCAWGPDFTTASSSPATTLLPPPFRCLFPVPLLCGSAVTPSLPLQHTPSAQRQASSAVLPSP